MVQIKRILVNVVYKYHEPIAILLVGDKAYQVYSKGKRGENHSLKFENIPKAWIGPTSRRIVSGKLTVGAVMLNDNNQAVLIRLLDGNENIYITVDKNYDEVMYARTGYNDAGEEVYIGMKFEDESEWAKQPFPENKGYEDNE